VGLFGLFCHYDPVLCVRTPHKGPKTGAGKQQNVPNKIGLRTRGIRDRYRFRWQLQT